MRLAFFLLAALCAPALGAEYGAKGLFPVYETGGQWLVFDKAPKASGAALSIGSRFLVVGSLGSELFTVTRTSATYGGACKNRKPARLRAALLKGPRSAVGSPILAIAVKPSFSMAGSRAKFTALKNEVDEGTYQTLDAAIRAAAIGDVKAGRFPLQSEDDRVAALQEPAPRGMVGKIDFGAKIDVAGLGSALFFVEDTQIGASRRRCARVAVGEKLIGDCVPMPHALMAETSLLQFVSYDPSGTGKPFVLAYTPSEPLWGHERWGFAVRGGGAQLFLADAMDKRCREGF